ncbi:hypothetical protein WMY93_024500 [Mugilogobius chulae]|uniref:Uncharacterized protein n=1 Tax=Mugilogobius chulae TaxID=88201 RepID=A0AAW0MZS3_9GOBI
MTSPPMDPELEESESLLGEDEPLPHMLLPDSLSQLEEFGRHKRPRKAHPWQTPPLQRLVGSHRGQHQLSSECENYQWLHHSGASSDAAGTAHAPEHPPHRDTVKTTATGHCRQSTLGTACSAPLSHHCVLSSGLDLITDTAPRLLTIRRQDHADGHRNVREKHNKPVTSTYRNGFFDNPVFQRFLLEYSKQKYYVRVNEENVDLEKTSCL